MKYFGYSPATSMGLPFNAGPFKRYVGTNIDEILSTFSYYNDVRGFAQKIPLIEELIELDSLVIDFSLPWAGKRVIEAKVRENVTFKVNINAFAEIQKLALFYQQLKRGDLYKVDCKIPSLGIWYLPEHIMVGLKEYNWSQHQKQANEWLTEWQKGMAEIEKKGGHLICTESKKN